MDNDTLWKIIHQAIGMIDETAQRNGFAHQNPIVLGPVVAALIHHDAAKNLGRAISEAAIVIANAGLE